MKSFRTCVFDVKMNSKRKESLLDRCMKNTELAYYQELKKLESHLPHLIKLEQKKQKNEAYAELKKIVAMSVKKKHLSSAAKASLAEDVVAQISSTVELLEMGQEAKLPKLSDKEKDYYLDGLNLLQYSTTLEVENEAKDLIYKKNKIGYRPLNFLKSRKSDGAMILMDELKRYYVYLNLVSSQSKYAKPCVIKDMVHLRTGEILNFKSETGQLFPLNLSKSWHQKEFIEKGQAKSYKLVKKYQNKFELHVAYEAEVEKIEPKTYLGIDRGIDALASMAIYNGRKVFLRRLYSGRELKAYQKKYEYKQKIDQMNGRKFEKTYSGYSDHIIHVITKKIVFFAKHYQSQVVLENLTSIANGHHHKREKYARKSNFNRMLSRQQYQKLQNVLTYKLQLSGLPKPIFVYASGTSLTCNVCGHYDKANRLTQAEFKCVHCGNESHADINAASNIAMKGYWLKANYDKKNKRMKIKFNEWLKQLNQQKQEKISSL